MPKPTVRNLVAIRQGTATPAMYFEAFSDLMSAVNNISTQGNTNPNGPVAAPPQISAVTAKVLSPGVHQVSIEDNSPVNRGIIYHFELSTTPHFETGTVVLAQSGPSKDAIVNTGAGPLFWRGFSQYLTSDPSLPVYAGAAVDAGGAARTTPLTGAGSGTEPISKPQGGAGFGFTSNRPDQL